MLIVSSIDHAEKAFRDYHPAWVISILSAGETAPQFEGLPAERHLVLTLSDEDSTNIKQAARTRAEELNVFVQHWRADEDILIHCQQGACRSMAAAYVLLCAAEPGAAEDELAQRLRAAAPHADPCLMMIAEADRLAQRDGRMCDAIEALDPPTPIISAPVVTLPVAA